MALLEYKNNEDWVLIARGNELALQRVYSFYYEPLFAFSYTILKDQFLSEEVIQDTFISLWEHREQLLTVKSPVGFLYVIARNKAFNCLKAKAKNAVEKSLDGTLQKQDEQPSPMDRVLEKEYAGIFTSLLDLLNRQERNVFILSRMEGNSYKEIAAKMGISVETVKSHIKSSLRKIRMFLYGNGALMLLLIFYFTEKK